jgi:quinol monooxygenase YgiN
VLQVKVTIYPKDTEAFISHFRRVYDNVVAEPECAYFLVDQNVQEPGVFRWFEGWTKGMEWFMSVCYLLYTEKNMYLEG